LQDYTKSFELLSSLGSYCLCYNYAMSSCEDFPDLPYWIAFSRIPGIGPARIRKLLAHFGGLQRAWEANALELKAAEMDDKSIGIILKARKSINPHLELEKLESRGIKPYAYDSPSYPRLLSYVPNPPVVIYVQGDIVQEDECSVAVVGTRKATAYGREVVSRIVTGLVMNGVTVVSGLARGIDSYAHRAALEAGGRTIAVLGSGLDQVYPWENKKLADDIVRSGALVSEYPLGTRPEARNFPPRNRIITGLSLAVVVIEADMKSGALISAGFAAQQGREVMAVPGSILSPTSAGTNYLIQQGAKLISRVEDILEELDIDRVSLESDSRSIVTDDPTEQALLDVLGNEPKHIDDIAFESNMPIAVVSASLTMMEIKGIVRSNGMFYSLAT